MTDPQSPTSWAIRAIQTEATAAEREKYRALVEAARYQHETGDLHDPDHSPPYEYCCAVGAALADLEADHD